MNSSEKIAMLREVLDRNLLSNISKECIYLDLPYHLNIGDTLIWDGTDEFLKQNNIKCLYKASSDTYRYQNISTETTVVLHGGGNFGDIWQKHQDFRLNIVRKYTENKIIILPQTVYYQDIDRALKDAQEMSLHSNLTICARDERSYVFLKKYFVSNNILLVPDMAFYIPEERLNKYRISTTKESLLLKRTDKESKDFDGNKIGIPSNSDIKDWPSMEIGDLTTSIFNNLLKIDKRLNGALKSMINLFCQKILKDHLVKIGVKFISPYKQIYTTRLHVAILCVLLDKTFVFLDNSYGKNRGFYETWLTDLDGIKFINEND